MAQSEMPSKIKLETMPKPKRKPPQLPTEVISLIIKQYLFGILKQAQTNQFNGAMEAYTRQILDLAHAVPAFLALITSELHSHEVLMADHLESVKEIIAQHKAVCDGRVLKLNTDHGGHCETCGMEITETVFVAQKKVKGLEETRPALACFESEKSSCMAGKSKA